MRLVAAIAEPCDVHDRRSRRNRRAGRRSRPRRAVVTGARDKAMRAARTCYDHLAGQLGVRLADALCERGYVELSDEGGAVTEPGMEFFRSFGLDLVPAPVRVYCRPCLDW